MKKSAQDREIEKLKKQVEKLKKEKESPDFVTQKTRIL